MTLTQLEYILALAKHLHFGRAAEACSVSQPTLSVQIQKLEEELDVRLFERGRTSVVLTDVGRELVAQARVILDEVRRLGDIASSFRSEVRGTLRLGLIPTIAPFLLPSVLPKLQKTYPQLRLEVFEQKTADLLSLLEHGDIDAAILSTPRSVPETLKEKVLYYEPFVLFAAKGHALRERAAGCVSVDDVKGFAAQLLDDTHCMRDQVESICRTIARDEQPVQIKAGTLQTLVEVVNASNGYTLLPALAQGVFKRTHAECFREFSDPKPSRKVSLVFHRSFLKRPLIEALASLIQENLPPGVLPVSRKAQAKVVDPKAQRFEDA